MSENKLSSPSVPGVPAGKTLAPPLVTTPPPGEPARLPSNPDAAKKSVIAAGGNKGGRPRNDGLVPGSAEAIEKDRLADAERKRNERARASAAKLPPPLPSPETQNSAPAPSSGLASPVVATEGLEWVPADLQQIAPELIDLLETLDVTDQISLATEGKLPDRVVSQIGKDAAWPVPTKQTLRNSSPATLAKVFNALSVPLAFKPYVTTCPLVVYLYLRRVQNLEAIKKLIAEESARRTPAAPVAPTP